MIRRRLHVLVITEDAIGERMAGPAIRAWNIADVLAGRHEVRLASTRRAEGSSPRFAVCDGTGHNLPGLAVNQDVIVVQGLTLRNNPWLIDTGARLVVDLYDPMYLEMLQGEQDRSRAQRRHDLDASLAALRIQLEHGDFFLCATERQRDLWLGHLGGAGRVNVDNYDADPTLRKLIDLAPFGTDEPPADWGPSGLRGQLPGVDEGDQVLLWAGGVYNWFDPVTLVQAVGDLAAEFPRLRLVFLGTKHPSVDDLSTRELSRAMAVATERDLLGTSVFFREGWVPYAERGRFLADADIGVSTHYLHSETAYSFRTRMLDYLWAGLPIVCTEGDEFARLVDRHDLGAVVAEQDRAGLAQALRELLGDPERLAQARANVTALAPHYRWQRVLQPLLDYCENPWRAADLPGRRAGAPVPGKAPGAGLAGFAGRVVGRLRRTLVGVSARLRRSGPTGSLR